MGVINNHFIKPGYLEVITGSMYSFKTLEEIRKAMPLQHIKGVEYMFIRPKIDTRTSRIDYLKLLIPSKDWVFVDQNNPEEVLSLITPNISYISWDEMNLYTEKFLPVLDELLIRKIHMVTAGLDLNFRGEPFGIMPKILARANKVQKCVAVCTYEGCGREATRTQRLIDGKPANYDSPLILIEGEDENVVYEARCLEHHYVSGKPKIN